MRQRSLAAYLILGFYGLMASPLLADGTLLGTINGKVVDQDGKALPGATVEVTSDGQGILADGGVGCERGLTTSRSCSPALTSSRSASRASRRYEAKRSRRPAGQDDRDQRDVEARGDRRRPSRSPGRRRWSTRRNTSDTTNGRLDADPEAGGRPRLPEPDLVRARRHRQPLGRQPQLARRADSATTCTSSTASTRPTRRREPSARTSTTRRSRKSTSRRRASRPSTAARRARSSTSSRSRARTSSTGRSRLLLTNDNWNAQNKGANPHHRRVLRPRQDGQVLVPDYNYTLGGPVWQDHVWFFGSYETREATTASAAQTRASTVYPEPDGPELPRRSRTPPLGRQALRSDHALAALDGAVQQRPDYGFHRGLLGRLGGRFRR